MGSVTEAIVELQELRPHAALIDLNLDDGSGERIIQYIVDKKLPITMVVISGNPDGMSTFAKTHAKFMRKPFGVEELLEEMRRVPAQTATVEGERQQGDGHG